jgi:N-ethylmaleimide reductase
MKTPSLFDAIKLGSITLNNRIVMAPMTRSRSEPDHTPTDIMVEYYRQRATAGLIITEGTSPSPDGDGYPRTPGIYTQEQIAQWQKITQAVHEVGGKIFLQIMHVGRIAHPLNKAPSAKTVAPSAISAEMDMYTDQEGMKKTVVPHALSIDEISLVIEDYRRATQHALEAGFDGVELHAANGYLPCQFLSSNTNHRTDAYGGTAENRIRFVVELLKAMSSVKGADKVGIRISPQGSFNGINDANPAETYSTLLTAINPLNLAYVHSVRAPDPHFDVFTLVRNNYQGLSIINGGFTLDSAEVALESGLADMVSFGSLYIANPNLVERFKNHLELKKPNASTFYTPGPVGYIDY